jgi:hypothetical protein
LRSFGGTPLLLNLDNFKAAVRNADWFDPDINPKLADFCRHYGMHVLPCRPGRPEHKGKVERGIAYVGSNALKVSFLSRWPTLNELQRAEAHTVRSFFYAHNSRSRSRIEKRLQQIGQAHEVTDDPALIEPMILTTKCLVAQLRQFNRAINGFDRKIKELFKSHPDHFLFEALPGAGEKLAPRLLVLFGSDRSRWPDATDIQKYSGVAPVIERSGKSVWVHRRLSWPIFVCQTFHEFAQQSTRFSPWADQFYRRQREKGKSHHSAIRSLAFKWIRIVFACWKANEPYDESLYVNALAKRTSSPSST